MIICNYVLFDTALFGCLQGHQEVPMFASASPFRSSSGSILVPPRGEGGSASGGVRLLLRLEGLAALAVAVALYAHGGFSWPSFALFLLAPDLSMLGYLLGPRAGAAAYNLVHTYVLALTLTLAGFFGTQPALTAAGLILIAHIGLDRALGYGLKYSTAFGDTHLGRTGRR
jgi:Domain of unknown function (DUF4260)